MNLSRENILWASGFLEGEGSLYAHINKRNRGRIYPQYSAGSTDMDVLCRLQKMFGGKIYGPFMKKRLGKKPVYQWMLLNSLETYALCMALYQFMGQRRKAKTCQVLHLWYSQKFLSAKQRRMGNWKKLPLFQKFLNTGNLEE